MSEDPFDLLRERLIVAAGGRTNTGRRGALAVVLAAAVLCLAAAAAAAVTLTGDEEPKPRTGVVPSPSPGVTPSPPPLSTATPPPYRPPSAQPRSPRGTTPSTPPSTVPTPIPTPVAPANYQVELIPDLTAGSAGWCVGVSEQGSGFRMAGRGCGPASPPGTRLIAAGGLIGRGGLMYAVVDRSVVSVRLSNGRRIATRRDPGVAPWRVAIWDVDVLPGGSPPDFTLHDSTGRELLARPAVVSRTLPTRKVNAKRPSKARCAIRARQGSGLRAGAQRLLTKFEPLDVVRPSFLSCSSAVFYRGNRRYRAAVVLNARDLKALAPPLPEAPNSISARRVGPGWLVVFGGRAGEREQVLASLSARKP